MTHQVKQTAPGVWAVGPWPHAFVAVYEDRGGDPIWHCQECQATTVLSITHACEHIRAAWKSLITPEVV